MKRLLVLLLALLMTGFASAGIINVVRDNGRGGWSDNNQNGWVDASDTIAIKITLAAGYYLSPYDLDIHVTGPGTLSEYVCSYSWVNEDGDTETGSRLGPGASFEPGNHIDDGMQGGLWGYSGIAGNGIAQMTDGRMGWWSGDTGGTDLVWGLLIHCDSLGPVIVDLTLHGDTLVKQGSTGTPFLISNADLGDFVILSGIPEPATFLLLGFGAAMLRKK